MIEDETGPGFDPETRRLCPDEACVGLLDDTGRCKVCGLEGEGMGAPPSGDAPPEDARVADEDGTADDDFTERRLCPDGSCIGLLDENGRCKVCGRSGD